LAQGPKTTKIRPLIKHPEKDAFESAQLTLFQTFLCNTQDERDHLSNTIELWDSVPKYFCSRQRMTKSRDANGFLPTLTWTFKYNQRSFTVKIRPARMTAADGKDIEFYPSAREELVEEALRKIAAEQGYGFHASEESGVAFTLYMLRKELQARQHTLSYQEIVEALDVMAGCHIEIHTADSTGDYQAPILVGLIRVNRNKYREDPKDKWIAYFNPLVTRSITSVTYRQYNYHKMMSHTTQLARWLHKRLAHNYVNASTMIPYNILYSTIEQDSGLLQYSEIRQSVRKLDESILELKSAQVLLSFTKDVRRGNHNAIQDVLYILTPHPHFISEIKAANKRHSDAQRTKLQIEDGRRRSQTFPSRQTDFFNVS